MQFKNEFQIDHESKTVSFAETKWMVFNQIKSASDVPSMFYVYGNPKKANKEFTEKYGITPTNFKKCFNAIMNKLWIEPVEKHVIRFGFTSSGKINCITVDAIWKVKEQLDQCEKDGIENIIPFVIKTGMSPQQLKEHFGKSLWKKITKQSMSRNRYIAPRVKHRDVDLASTLTLPSHILKRGMMSNIPWNDCGEWLLSNGIYKACKGTHYEYRDLNEWTNFYTDTKRMAGQLGKNFSQAWSPEKMKQKHEEFVKLIMLKKYSSTPFAHLVNFKLKEIAEEGVRAVICDSALAVHQEGEIMHHCVGSYANYVAEGRYLVYAFSVGGERSSTLGIWAEDGKYRYNQHYGFCNKRVENEKEKQLALKIINLLNETKNLEEKEQ